MPRKQQAPQAAPAEPKKHTKKATHLKVRNAKPGEGHAGRRIDWYADGFGQRIGAGARGRRTYIYKYRLNGDQGWMVLGDADAIDLKEAHRRHAIARALVLDGKDPKVGTDFGRPGARRAAKVLAHAEATKPTLRKVFLDMATDPDFLALGSHQEIARQIELDIIDFSLADDDGKLGDKPLERVEKRDAVLVVSAARKRASKAALERAEARAKRAGKKVPDAEVKRIEAQVGKRIANAVASNFVRLGRYAVAKGFYKREEDNVLRGFARARIAPKSRAPGVNPRDEDDDRGWELRRILERLPNVDLHPVTMLALLFVLVTAQRPGEVAGMSKSELNRDRTLWKIPPERYKTAWHDDIPKPHVVPLSSLARLLLDYAAVYNDDSDWVFPSPVGRAEAAPQHLDPHSLPRAVKRKLGAATPAEVEPKAGELGVEPFTPHDLRRAARTGFSALGVQSVVAEKILGHKLAGMDAVYNQHSFLKEKTEALQKWADHLLALAPGLDAALLAQATKRKMRKTE